MSTPLSTLLSTLLVAVLRTTSHYELVKLDQLTPNQQDLLSDLRNRPDVVGVLRPSSGWNGNLKAISQDVATLYSALAEPMRLPEAVRTVLDEAGAGEIAKLVLDGVLAIESGTAGNFVTGSDAYPLLYGVATACETESVAARLSRTALQYAQALELTDPAELSRRLYLYNRQPADRHWRRTLPDAAAVATYLGIRPGSAVAHRLTAAWQPATPMPGYDGWLAWSSIKCPLGRDESTLTYKLYISAPCEQMPLVFPAAVALLTKHPTFYLKVGSDLYGLLRPDKMVAYFANFAELQTAGAALQQALAGIPAQGVPFTASLDAAGLLSWGIDPPHNAQWLHWQPRESWRLWVTNRLAMYMVMARDNAAGALTPWQFAYERMRLDGIDVTTWTPQPAIWAMDAPPKEGST